mgnify:FL=1
MPTIVHPIVIGIRVEMSLFMFGIKGINRWFRALTKVVQSIVYTAMTYKLLFILVFSQNHSGNQPESTTNVRDFSSKYHVIFKHRRHSGIVSLVAMSSLLPQYACSNKHGATSIFIRTYIGFSVYQVLQVIH